MQIHPFHITCINGEAITPYLLELARLRIEVFRDWPYLYEGNIDYEMQYLNVYVQSPRSLCILVQANNHIVGASTGLPLSDENSEFQAPFLCEGWDIQSLFYFGESVLLPQFRGRGLGHTFFNYRQRYAQSFGCYRHTTFAAVNRPPEHPLRPGNYRELEGFWRKRGYSPHNELTMRLSWPEVAQTQSTEKTLTYWIKSEVTVP